MIDLILRLLFDISFVEILQTGVALLTVYILYQTMLTQKSTADIQNKTADLLNTELDFKFMPYFDIDYDDRGEYADTKAKKAIAFSIDFIFITEIDYFNMKVNTTNSIGFIEPGENFNRLNLKHARELIQENEYVKDQIIELGRLDFSDYTGKRYSQTYFYKNDGFFMTKPVVISQSNS